MLLSKAKRKEALLGVWQQVLGDRGTADCK